MDSTARCRRYSPGWMRLSRGLLPESFGCGAHGLRTGWFGPRAAGSALRLRSVLVATGEPSTDERSACAQLVRGRAGSASTVPPRC